MSYSNRIFLYGPLVLLLLIAAAVMIWWKIAAGAFDARLTAANGREIMPGVRMSYASKEMEGFPFRVDFVMNGFTLSVQMRTGPLVWHADHFAIHALTYGRNQQVFEAAGTQTLSWTDSEGAHRVLTFVPGSLRASAILDHGRLARFDVDAVALNSPELSAARIQFHMRREPGRDALDFAMSADGVHLAPDLRAGFGEIIKEANIEGRVVPAFPLEPLLAGQWDWRAAVDKWRHSNGQLDILDFELVSNRLKASTHGQLSLDDVHRPQGFMDVTLTGSVSDEPGAKLAAAVSQTMEALSHYVATAMEFRIGLHGDKVSVSTHLTYPTEKMDAVFSAGTIDPLY
jgi:hypothetical protein